MGLINVNVSQVMANAQVNAQDVVVDVSDVLNHNQIQALVEALNTNPQASANAERLTTGLQDQGVLGPTERVIGATGGKLYKAAIG
jgi:hypothetical protein